MKLLIFIMCQQLHVPRWQPLGCHAPSELASWLPATVPPLPLQEGAVSPEGELGAGVLLRLWDDGQVQVARGASVRLGSSSVRPAAGRTCLASVVGSTGAFRLLFNSS